MKIAKKYYDVDTNVVTFEFADGESVHVDMSELPEAIVAQAALHGISQKLGDSYSGIKEVSQARQACLEVLGNLEQGMWNAGRSSVTGGIWVEAIAACVSASLEEVIEMWNSLDDDKRKALKARPDVKLAKANIELERAKKKAEGIEAPDLDSLFG